MLLRIVRNIATLILITIIVNFVSFTYAHISLDAQRSLNPFGLSGNLETPPIFTLYGEYASAILEGNFGALPGAQGSVADTLVKCAGASLGILLIVFTFSTCIGLLIGLAAVKTDPAGVHNLMAPLASIGLALPGFFVAAILLSIIVYSLLDSPPGTLPILPTSGFGWDAHLILPVIALSIRPTAQIAQTSASLLSGEMNSLYVIAARAFGASWIRIRRRDGLRNILAPLIISISSSFRLLVAELVLVEFIFDWPGLGRLLARTLIPPATVTPGGLGRADIIFLHPPLLAGLMTVFALIFLATDFLAHFLAQRIDPRLINIEENVVASE